MCVLTRGIKNIVPRIVRDGGGAGAGGGRGGQGLESRFWEAEIPAFIERGMSSSITDPQALAAINDLFMVSHSVISVWSVCFVLSICCSSSSSKRLRDETAK